jgi:hypothetical protein
MDTPIDYSSIATTNDLLLNPTTPAPITDFATPLNTTPTTSIDYSSSTSSIDYSLPISTYIPDPISPFLILLPTLWLLLFSNSD